MTIWWRFHLSYAEVVTVNFTWHYTWAGGAAGQWPGTSQTSGQSATCSIVPLLSYRDQQHLPWWYRHDNMKYIMYLLSTLHNICPCCSKFHAHLMCESTFKYNMVTHQVSRCSLSVGSDHSVLLSRPHCLTSGLARSSRSVWPVVAQQVLLPVGHTQASSSSPLITSPITTMQLPVLAHSHLYWWCQDGNGMVAAHVNTPPLLAQQFTALGGWYLTKVGSGWNSAIMEWLWGPLLLIINFY